MGLSGAMEWSGVAFEVAYQNHKTCCIELTRLLEWSYGVGQSHCLNWLNQDNMSIIEYLGSNNLFTYFCGNFKAQHGLVLFQSLWWARIMPTQ